MIAIIIAGLVLTCTIAFWNDWNTPSSQARVNESGRIKFSESSKWMVKLQTASRVRFERTRRDNPGESLAGDLEIHAFGPLDSENKLKVYLEISSLIDSVSADAIAASKRAERTGELRHFVDSMESAYYQAKAVAALQLLENEQYWTLLEGLSSPPLPTGYVSIAWSGVAQIEGKPVLIYFPIATDEHDAVASLLDAFAAAELAYVREVVQQFNQLALSDRKQRIEAHILATQIFGDHEAKNALATIDLEVHVNAVIDERLNYETEFFTLSVGSLYADKSS